METANIKPIRFKINLNLSENATNIVLLIIALACVFLFASSALTKVVDNPRFVHGLSKVAYIGAYAQLIGWMVPIAEILITVLLIVPQTRRWGLIGFAGLMTVFSIYIFSMLLWAKKLPCNCNLLIENLSWGAHLAFNVTWIGIAVIGIRLSKISSTH